jgi:prevent-host-death family protein
MKALSVSEFKARMAGYLREVKQGEKLIITEHQRPVAEVYSADAERSLVVPATRPFSLDGSRPVELNTGLALDLVTVDRDGR